MKIVKLAGLGICEHCQALLNMEDMPADALDAEWRCPSCQGVLSHKSFGYTSTGEKIQWIGIDGQWTNEKPSENFTLGELEVHIQSTIKVR